jgi:hypothetical protein
VKSTPGGVGEKTIEMVVIPRQAGVVSIPAFRFEYFDPKQKKYVVESTPPLELRVTPGKGGEAMPEKKPAPATGDTSTPVRPRVIPGAAQVEVPSLVSRVGKFIQDQIWKLFVIGTLVIAAVFLLFGLRSVIRRRLEAARNRKPDLDDIAGRIRKISVEIKSIDEAFRKFEELNHGLYEALDLKFGLRSRALPRSELKMQLVVEQGMDPAKWGRWERLFEAAETAQYAPARSLDDARAQLRTHHQEAVELVRELKAFVRSDSQPQ